MSSRIEQNVRDDVSHLARRPQQPDVHAIGKHAASSRESPIYCSRKSREDRLEATREIECTCRLDDQMRVIVLDRVVGEPEAGALAGLTPASFELGNEPPVPQAWNVTVHFQCHVARIPRCE
jgi:hypothetical protein